MADEQEKAPRELLSRYEWRWIAIALTGLAVFLGLSIGFTMSHRGRLPMTPKIDPVQKILAGPLFSHPGVTRLGPGHYRAVIVARQFSFDPDSIKVPVGARVDFYITSADVVHGFEMPGSNMNVEVFPGYVAHVHERFRHPGSFRTVCNQYCGIGHQTMLGKFAVLSKAAYRKSLTVAAAPAATGMIVGIAAAPIADGKTLFGADCTGCHQATGQGLPGAFPPLAGSLSEYNAAAGRKVLAHILLFGLNGPIKAKGKTYNGVMPAWGAQLKDKQIADLLDYIETAWGNTKALPKFFKPFVAAEIAKDRTPKLTPAMVAAEHAKLPAPQKDASCPSPPSMPPRFPPIMPEASACAALPSPSC
jgi:heme/copper-type cytochrome/quinol oxidase subunit 2